MSHRKADCPSLDTLHARTIVLSPDPVLTPDPRTRLVGRPPSVGRRVGAFYTPLEKTDSGLRWGCSFPPPSSVATSKPFGVSNIRCPTVETPVAVPEDRDSWVVGRGSPWVAPFRLTPPLPPSPVSGLKERVDTRSQRVETSTTFVGTGEWETSTSKDNKTNKSLPLQENCSRPSTGRADPRPAHEPHTHPDPRQMSSVPPTAAGGWEGGPLGSWTRNYKLVISPSLHSGKGDGPRPPQGLRRDPKDPKPLQPPTLLLRSQTPEAGGGFKESERLTTTAGTREGPCH